MDNINNESVALDLQVNSLNAVEKKPACPERRANVRFTEKEWDRILREKDVTGRSIPELLKNRFFHYPAYVTALSPETQQAILMLHRRMSNNLNQIAKVLNSGFREGWSNGFLEVRNDLSEVRRLIAGVYGNH